MNKHIALILAFVNASLFARAEVKPNILFSDNMVLQKGIKVPVWGTAKDGEKVTLVFGKQKYTTVAQNGKWLIKLNPLSAGGPFMMTIEGENMVTIKNILVGEVWVCGGQSNMERQLGPRNGQPLIDNWMAEAADAVNYPTIREFAVQHIASDLPLAEVKGKWVICDTQNVKNFSAVGYFFARQLNQKLHVPIGLIHSSWGGTPAEKWISRDSLESNAELKNLVEAYNKALKNYPDTLDKYKQIEATLLAKWVSDTVLANQNKKAIPRKPTPPINPLLSGDCGGLYNAMIAPLIPYAIKGVIWYQGESNSSRAKQYKILFPLLIADWRKRWQEGDFAFLFVQLAPYNGNSPELREAQLQTFLTTPNTAMIVTTDCVDSTFNLHPAQKKPVGERLSLAARALAYQEKIEYSGPVYQSAMVDGNKIIISFTHCKNLIAKGGDLKGFMISGADKKFIDATAYIKGNTVIVSADEIANPTSVRFGFINKPVLNLYNEVDLPASPFRTDVP